MTYLLDTNVWVAFLRNPGSPVGRRLCAQQPNEVFVCSVVVAELYHGCLRSANASVNRSKVDLLLQPYVSLPFDDSAAEQYASVRRHLETLGTPVGPYDLQIAAIALTHGSTLVTHNMQEFSRVPGLLLEDWQLP